MILIKDLYTLCMLLSWSWTTFNCFHPLLWSSEVLFGASEGHWKKCVTGWVCVLVIPAIHINEIHGLNFSQDAGYPLLRFLWSCSVPPGKCEDSTMIIFFPSTCYLTLYRQYGPVTNSNIKLPTKRKEINVLQPLSAVKHD